MPSIKDHMLTIQQEATDNKKEHTRKDREEQLENLMTLFDLMKEKGPDAEINLKGKDFVLGKKCHRKDGVLSNFMKDMDDQRLLDAIKNPEDFSKIFYVDYEKKATANRK